VIALPMEPVDSVAECIVFTLEVESVEIRIVASAVPPGTFKPLCTVVLPSIMVVVNGAELGTLLRQTVGKLPLVVRIDQPILEGLGADDKVVDDNLGGVPVPVLQGDQELLSL